MKLISTILRKLPLNNIWVRLVVTIFVIETFDDFVVSPLLELFAKNDFWVNNTLYKIIEFMIAIMLNAFYLKIKVFFDLLKRQSLRKEFLAVTGILLYFGVALGIQHPTRVIEGLIIGLIAAIPEEFIWRGLILGYIAKNIDGDSKARAIRSLLISSLFFGLYHLSNLHVQSLSVTLAQVIQTFGLGMILGAIYLKSGNLLNSMLVHFFWDFFTTLANGINLAKANYVNWTATLLITLMLVFIGIRILNPDKKGAELIERLS